MNTDSQKRASKLEAILAREIIDLADDFQSSEAAIESIAEICFTLDRLMKEIGRNDDNSVKWNNLFSYYDQAYVQLKNKRQDKLSDKELRAEYNKAIQKIDESSANL